MTKSLYRQLVLLSLGATIIGSMLDLVMPALVSETLRQAQEAHEAQVPLARHLATAAVAVIGLAAALVANYGLYRFRPWAPRLGVVVTIAALLASPMLGQVVQSGWAVSFSYAACQLWGVVLVLSLVQPYSSWFARQAAAGPG